MPIKYTLPKVCGATKKWFYLQKVFTEILRVMSPKYKQAYTVQKLCRKVM